MRKISNLRKMSTFNVSPTSPTTSHRLYLVSYFGCWVGDVSSFEVKTSHAIQQVVHNSILQFQANCTIRTKFTFPTKFPNSDLNSQFWSVLVQGSGDCGRWGEPLALGNISWGGGLYIGPFKIIIFVDINILPVVDLLVTFFGNYQNLYLGQNLYLDQISYFFIIEFLSKLLFLSNYHLFNSWHFYQIHLIFWCLCPLLTISSND